MSHKLFLRFFLGVTLAVSVIASPARAATLPQALRLHAAGSIGATGSSITLGACCATRVAWSPDGKLLLVAGQTTLHLLNANGSAAAVRTGLRSPIVSIAWAPDSKTFATGSSDGLVRTYTTGAAERLSLVGHAGPVNAVAWATNGSLLLSASDDGQVKVWQSNGEHLTNVYADFAPVSDVSWSAVHTIHGNILAFSSTHDVWIKTVSNRLIARIAQGQGVTSVRWSPAGDVLVTGARDGSVSFWNTAGTLLMTSLGHTGPVTSLAWSADGTRLATGSADRTVRVWSATGQLLSTLSGYPGSVQGVSWLSDDRTLATVAGDNAVRLWHLAS